MYYYIITLTATLAAGQFYGPNDTIIPTGHNFMHIDASYEQRQEARYLGADFDKQRKKWFVVYNSTTDAIVTKGIVFIYTVTKAVTNHALLYSPIHFLT